MNYTHFTTTLFSFSPIIPVNPVNTSSVCPGNVLLSAANVPVLMDFGSVAPARVEIKTRTEALDLQDVAATNSSQAYRAPELFDVPRNTSIDERTDVWSLGAMLFALSFGRGYSPFECELDQSGASRSGYRAAPCTHLRVIARVDFPDQVRREI